MPFIIAQAATFDETNVFALSRQKMDGVNCRSRFHYSRQNQYPVERPSISVAYPSRPTASGSGIDAANIRVGAQFCYDSPGASLRAGI